MAVDIISKENPTTHKSGALGIIELSIKASQRIDSISMIGVLKDIGGRTKVFLTGDYDGSLELHS